MKQEFCIGICPRCDGNGLILVERNNEKLNLCCDECYLGFNSPEDFFKNKAMPEPRLTGIDATLEEALVQGWADYIYVLENGKWLKYTDKTKKLF